MAAAAVAATPTPVAATTRPAPDVAPPDEPPDWDAPPEPQPPTPAAATDATTEDDASALWDVPDAPSPPLAPDSDTVDAHPSPPPEDVETTAARRAARRSPRRRLDRVDLPLLPTLIAVQLVVIGAGLIWRADIVRWMPQTASFFRAVGFGVNVRGLTFADVHTLKDDHDGVTVLIVEGAIMNTASSTVVVPRLRFALRNAGLAEVFSWTAPAEKGTLGPGETLPFRSRLASPPRDGNDILVRFMNRMDFMNGAR
jgi:hypothetical protein